MDRSTSSHLTTDQVVDMLDFDVSDDEDYDRDEMFFPGSDDELGFEELEIGDESDQEEEDAR